MKIALVQYSPEWENPEKNIDKINGLLKDVSLTEIDLVVFPELTLTGFTMNVAKFAEEIDGPSYKFFIDLAGKKKVNVIGGVIEKDGNKFYNTLLHIDENGLIKARYRKIHPFSFANEEKYFAAGNELVITEINKIKIGLSVCYDLRFPELYRLYALKGAEVLVNIANWPVPRIAHWDLLTKANAVFAQAFFIGVNRTGKDPFNEYCGHSRVISPLGNAETEITEEEKIIVCEIDIAQVKETREKYPFLNDVKLLR